MYGSWSWSCLVDDDVWRYGRACCCNASTRELQNKRRLRSVVRCRITCTSTSSCWSASTSCPPCSSRFRTWPVSSYCTSACFDDVCHSVLFNIGFTEVNHHAANVLCQLNWTNLVNGECCASFLMDVLWYCGLNVCCGVIVEQLQLFHHFSRLRIAALNEMTCRGLIRPLILLFLVFLTVVFRNNLGRFLQDSCPSCHPLDSVKTQALAIKLSVNEVVWEFKSLKAKLSKRSWTHAVTKDIMKKIAALE